MVTLGSDNTAKDTEMHFTFYVLLNSIYYYVIKGFCVYLSEVYVYFLL